MKEIKLNSGTATNPTVLDTPFAKDEYIILESGTYVLAGSVLINEVKGTTIIKEMWGSSQVKEMWGSSQVKEMWGSSGVFNIKSDAVTINCYGFNTLIASQKIPGVKLNETSSLIIIPSIQGNFEVYSKSYPVKVSGGFARLYKAVHKDKDGKYRADYDKSFAYIISKKVTCECDQQTLQSCSFGIHVSHLQWAVNFGKSWDDLAILEMKVKVSDIVVSADCDGKVRTSAAIPIREVPKEEYEQYL